jgi:hypothetical protein
LAAEVRFLVSRINDISQMQQERRYPIAETQGGRRGFNMINAITFVSEVISRQRVIGKQK